MITSNAFTLLTATSSTKRGPNFWHHMATITRQQDSNSSFMQMQQTCNEACKFLSHNARMTHNAAEVQETYAGGRFIRPSASSFSDCSDLLSTTCRQLTSSCPPEFTRR